jgi:deoxyribose-phosphate aldolase
MAETVGRRLAVESGGGIRATADAVAMLDAGATRLGLLATGAVLDGLSPSSPDRSATTMPPGWSR